MQKTITDGMLATARRIIGHAESSLGRVLTDGERRDLLKDNTQWRSDTVAALVDALRSDAGIVRHPAFTDDMARQLVEAWDRGKKAALALRPGQKFTGAFGAAEAAGYTLGKPEAGSFTSGYLSVLPRPIVTRGMADLTLVQIGERVLKAPDEIRFWFFLNSESIKIKLRKGQTLRHATVFDNGEGWTCTTRVWFYDGETVTVDWCNDGTDCDGRHSSSGSDTCAWDKVGAGTAYDGGENSIRFPLWSWGKTRQRDYAAEAMGY